MARRGVLNPGAQSGFAIIGDEEVKKILNEIAPKNAANLLRSTIHGIAGTIRDNARKNAKAVGNADLDNIAKNLKSKRKKSPADRPISVVQIEHGLGVPGDPWYWHFWEFGTKERFLKSGQSVGRIPEIGYVRAAQKSARRDIRTTERRAFTKALKKKIKAEKKKLLKAGL